MTNYHVPVLLQAAVEALDVRPDGVYADVTFGGGGHSRAILERLGLNGRLIGLDQDPEAWANAPDDSRLQLLDFNFRDLADALNAIGLGEENILDGILADLGVSSHQFDIPKRGFAHRFEAPLDMRMNPSEGDSAANLLKTTDLDELTHWFKEYGELPQPRRAARAVLTAIEEGGVETTGQLNAVLEPIFPVADRSALMSQAYQALRIAVNDEINALDDLMTAALKALKPGGKMVVLSYHSLEDRLVKHHFRAGNSDGLVQTDFYGNQQRPWEEVTKKPILATGEEIKHNSRARSAKMRVATKHHIQTTSTND